MTKPLSVCRSQSSFFSSSRQCRLCVPGMRIRFFSENRVRVYGHSKIKLTAMQKSPYYERPSSEARIWLRKTLGGVQNRRLVKSKLVMWPRMVPGEGSRIIQSCVCVVPEPSVPPPPNPFPLLCTWLSGVLSLSTASTCISSSKGRPEASTDFEFRLPEPALPVHMSGSVSLGAEV